jgi:hypothetical protein
VELREIAILKFLKGELIPGGTSVLIEGFFAMQAEGQEGNSAKVEHKIGEKGNIYSESYREGQRAKIEERQRQKKWERSDSIDKRRGRHRMTRKEKQ